ncbi:excinuclease ABC subunit C [Halobacteriales archaeon SW_7_71_33]|nr:MAG: excinuclease ABC subunit C [Halobacteriales archaeon SW_7_71_33]
MDAAAVRERARGLPNEPGVYQFQADGTTLYVGKAVDLRDRVPSYAQPRSERVRRMVDHADGVEVTVTDTETQALLLEANLIKRHAPRYNVRLKDDKSYPMVQVTNHEAPRIEVTRDPDADAEAFGPYTSVGRVETVVKALRSVYGVRGCSDHKYAGRDRPCLDYEVGLCTAPCTGEIAVEEYVEDVESVRRFLAGEVDALAAPLREAMERAAQAENFERAANLRDDLEAVEAFHGGDEGVVDARRASATAEVERRTDVLGVAVDGEEATVARLRAEDGQLVDRDRHRLTGVDGERNRVAALEAFLPQFYAERDLPDTVLTPVPVEDDDLRAWLEREGVELSAAGAGRRGQLVDLATKNARRGREPDDGVSALAERLGHAVDRIEGFDVSHAGGADVVGSDVTFVDGEPRKADYRRKKLPEDNDDLASMRALIEWRAERAVEGRDDRPDPDLLVIDGGREQLRAAKAALDAVDWTVPLVGIAKGEDRDADRALTLDGPTRWERDAAHTTLLRRVRDEAHRFAVGYHRTVRDEVSTALDDVSGVGPATRRALLRRFGGVEGVREASREELTAVDGVGEELAGRVDRRL